MDGIQGSETAPKAPETPAVLADAQHEAADQGAELSEADRAILAYPELTLANGLELARWWNNKDRTGDYAERFEVMREYSPGNRSFGFFDVAPVGGRDIPVMGIVQEMFYDRQRPGTGELIEEQIQEFVLHYFMRISHQRQAEAATDPKDFERRVGFGYQQLYYKKHGSGVIGKFPESQQATIVDLRELGPVYDWIVLKVNIFDFNLSFSPFGVDGMRFQLPLKESTYLVIGPSFVTNQEKPEPGVRARYGFGYAFVPYAPAPGMIAYGPGHFAAAIQTVDFSISDTGETTVRAAFVVNRPDKIVTVDIAPLDWGFRIANLLTLSMASKVMKPAQVIADRLPLRITGLDPISGFIWLANTVTGGMAERDLGISKSTLEKRMLVQHFNQHYEMLVNSLLVWRRIPDWTDHDHLPDDCRLGTAL